MNIPAFLTAILGSGLIGIGILALGYWAFDKVTHFKLREVLTHERITGASIVAAAYLLGLCYLVGQAM